jgi:hypothetical protein
MSGGGGVTGTVVVVVVEGAAMVVVVAPGASVVVVDGAICAAVRSEPDANSPPATNAANAILGPRLQRRSR